jgi:hypothetical protein
MGRVIEIPEVYLWLSVGFAALVASACLVMGYVIGKDVCREEVMRCNLEAAELVAKYRPLRDNKGRFIKR